MNILRMHARCNMTTMACWELSFKAVFGEDRSDITKKFSCFAVLVSRIICKIENCNVFKLLNELGSCTLSLLFKLAYPTHLRIKEM